jgi:hypothetical protein
MMDALISVAPEKDYAVRYDTIPVLTHSNSFHVYTYDATDYILSQSSAGYDQKLTAAHADDADKILSRWPLKSHRRFPPPSHYVNINGRGWVGQHTITRPQISGVRCAQCGTRVIAVSFRMIPINRANGNIRRYNTCLARRFDFGEEHGFRHPH